MIGAPKAGTTSLAAGLTSHPEVWIPDRKELGYFDVRWRTEPLDQYRADFATAPTGSCRGEATPTYLHAPGAMERIAGAIPDVRLVAMLRDPVDRAWSHYWYNVTARLLEHRPPRQAFAVDPDEYLVPGQYAKHLRRLLDHFGPTQLHVLTIDELVADADAAFRGVCRHLGVDEAGVSDVEQRRNQAYEVRSPRLRRQMLRFGLWRRLPLRLGFRLDEWNRVRIETPAMPADLRRELTDWYGHDTEDLIALLARPVAWHRSIDAEQRKDNP